MKEIQIYIHVSGGEMISESKHLKGQLGPPVNHINVYGTKNEHYLNLCQDGQLGDPHESRKSAWDKK